MGSQTVWQELISGDVKNNPFFEWYFSNIGGLATLFSKAGFCMIWT
jgi:hypothetical protein